MRIEAVQQRRLHRAAPDLLLVETTGADVRPGLDGRSRSAARSISYRACFVEGDAPADQSRRRRPGSIAELARRVVDAGDAGPFLGDHPPGDVFVAAVGIGAAIAHAEDDALRSRVAPSLRVGACRSAAAASGTVVGSALLPGHGVLVGLAGRDAVRGGIGVGRRHRLIHVCALRLLGVLRPVDAGSPLRADETAGRETLALAKAGAAIGADRHRRQLHRLPVDRPPDRHLAVLLDHLVGADGVADRDVADDAGADVLPQRLDVVASAEADGARPS